MFVDKKSQDNPIHHSKELHDMLLEGYRHAIVMEDEEDTDAVEQVGEEGKSGKGSGKTPRLSSADITYELDRDGMIIRIEGFKDKETARMAYEELKQLLERQELDKEEQARRIRLLDLDKHLRPELHNE